MTEQQQPTGAPVPTNWSFGGVVSPLGARLCVAIVETPLGVLSFYLEPEAAKAIAEQMHGAARQVATGLILPPNAVNGIRKDQTDDD